VRRARLGAGGGGVLCAAARDVLRARAGEVRRAGAHDVLRARAGEVRDTRPWGLTFGSVPGESSMADADHLSRAWGRAFGRRTRGRERPGRPTFTRSTPPAGIPYDAGSSGERPARPRATSEAATDERGTRRADEPAVVPMSLRSCR
jgi:hypothetical protein